MNRVLWFIGFICISACASKETTLYQAIGGQPKIEMIVENFIQEIEFNKSIFPYFQDSSVSRFREKLVEHFCEVSEGPCKYSGDSMLDVHRGMGISESDFNLTVELLMNAMNSANISHQNQNRLLKALIPLREDIIYQ